MEVYIRTDQSGEPYDSGSYCALQACKNLNINVKKYKIVYSLQNYDIENLIVGTVSDIKEILDQNGIEVEPLDYPSELKHFLGREIWKSTLFDVIKNIEEPIFVKPVYETKRFSGTVLEKSDDVVKLGGSLTDIDVWCSKTVKFVSEWRLWVLHGEIVALTPYRGKWDIFPDTDILKKAVSLFKSAPSAYALDFAITDKNETLLVEFSDAYGLQSMGLNPNLYLKILTARWKELVSNVK